MFQQFYNRENEIEFLEKSYKSKKPGLIIIYGRRRVGKTELVKHFIKNKPSVYFLADERGDYQNLKELQGLMGGFLNDNVFKKVGFNDWVELFNEFSKRLKSKAVIIIDEFPYLITSNKAIPSIFQKIWDTNLSTKEVCLILLGSSISMMETHTLSYKSPLYGRRTGQWKLQPLDFEYLYKFFPNLSTEEIIKVYSVTDGIPAYILSLDLNADFSKNLTENVLKQGSFLYQEAEILLKQELRELANYFNILKAIAMGKTKYGEIVSFTGLDKTLVSKYLNTLIVLHVIKKEFPVTQKKELRNTMYLFEDNYYNFWFRFVYPNKSLLEGGNIKGLRDIIKTDMNLYLSSAFEKVCKKFIVCKPPFVFNKIGKWWHKEEELDIVALNEETKEILFVECKWQDRVDALKILLEIKDKSKLVPWHNQKRKEYFIIFAKSFKEKIKEPNLTLFDLKDFDKAFRN